jgi:hypothetical protein
MSKERELLQRILDYMWEGELADEIKELLDQPEQEPVAWMYEWYENDLESTQAYCGSEKPFKGESTQPFNLRPLYAAPQKRKPLSEYFICLANQSLLEVTRLAFRKGVKFAEKAHGIRSFDNE